MDIFTIEEQNLMYIFDTTTRVRLLSEIQMALPYITNQELKSIMLTIIQKLEMIDDVTFDMSPLDFMDYDDIKNN
ncbi:TPA: transposon-transfer assisting family protein [Listeria monocytogenes]